jgi:hypothetical protein
MMIAALTRRQPYGLVNGPAAVGVEIAAVGVLRNPIAAE